MNRIVFGVFLTVFLPSCELFDEDYNPYSSGRNYQYEPYKPYTPPPKWEEPKPKWETPKPPPPRWEQPKPKAPTQVTRWDMQNHVLFGEWQKISDIIKESRWPINDKFGQNSETLLHAVLDNYLKTGDLAFLLFILNRPGLNVDIGDIQDSTPLHRAASGTSERHLMATELLFQKGAIQSPNARAYTPLDEALERVGKCNEPSKVVEKLCAYKGSALRYQFICALGWYDPACPQKKQDSGNQKPKKNHPEEENNVDSCKEFYATLNPNFTSNWDKSNQEERKKITTQAFRVMTKKHHGDVGGDTQTMQRVNDCKTILMNAPAPSRWW